MQNSIYIAEDDLKISEILKAQLTNDGHHVLTFNNAQDLLKEFSTTPCDLVITDIMMPIMNGYDLCKEIRKSSDIPIIMISAKDEELNKLLGLELGSDDYISKPFSLKEISIKVKNMLRRYDHSASALSSNKDILICKDLILNQRNRTIQLANQAFHPTSKEFDLLEFLILNKNQAFSRETIIEKVWGYDYIGDSRQVDHLIKRLRKKILDLNGEFQITTLWGYGYKVSDHYEN